MNATTTPNQNWLCGYCYTPLPDDTTCPICGQHRIVARVYGGSPVRHAGHGTGRRTGPPGRAGGKSATSPVQASPAQRRRGFSPLTAGALAGIGGYLIGSSLAQQASATTAVPGSGLAAAGAGYFGIDLNADSAPDAFAADLFGGSAVDTVLADIDGDAVFDAIGMDSDEDGVVDAIGLDSDQDGVLDFVSGDADGDGVFDWAAADTDMDGILDVGVADVDADGIISAAEVVDLGSVADVADVADVTDAGGGLLDLLGLFG